MEISHKTCQWIGPNSESCSCSNPVVEGRSYCEDHIWLVYQKGTRLGRRTKDQKRAEAIWNIESEIHQIAQELLDEGVV